MTKFKEWAVLALIRYKTFYIFYFKTWIFLLLIYVRCKCTYTCLCALISEVSEDISEPGECLVEIC